MGKRVESRINAGTMDCKEVDCPDHSMWEDFDMLYYDPEVGLENPVDVKVEKVGERMIWDCLTVICGH